MSAIPVAQLPGVAVERKAPGDRELERYEVMHHNVYVGTVVYVRRRHAAGGSTYGWRPAKASPNARLDVLADAIRRLPQLAQQDGA